MSDTEDKYHTFKIGGLIVAGIALLILFCLCATDVIQLIAGNDLIFSGTASPAVLDYIVMVGGGITSLITAYYIYF
jgi:hypothetical protein